MYKVIVEKFTDLQDNRYVYAKGDEYPRSGYTPKAGRIAELSGSANRLCTPIIKKSADKKKAAVKDEGDA